MIPLLRQSPAAAVLSACLPRAIDAVWFDSEKLLGKGRANGSGFLLQGDCNDSREGERKRGAEFDSGKEGGGERERERGGEVEGSPSFGMHQ